MSLAVGWSLAEPRWKPPKPMIEDIESGFAHGAMGDGCSRHCIGGNGWPVLAVALSMSFTSDC